MRDILVSKELHSEWVVRSSLYWLSSVSTWTFDSSGDSWLISLSNDEEQVLRELHRLLNDFILREQLMASTEGVRNSIVSKVLASVNHRLSL